MLHINDPFLVMWGCYRSQSCHSSSDAASRDPVALLFAPGEAAKRRSSEISEVRRSLTLRIFAFASKVLLRVFEMNAFQIMWKKVGFIKVVKAYILIVHFQRSAWRSSSSSTTSWPRPKKLSRSFSMPVLVAKLANKSTKGWRVQFIFVVIICQVNVDSY